MTFGVIAVCVFVFCATWLRCGWGETAGWWLGSTVSLGTCPVLAEHGALVMHDVWIGQQWWRLLTALAGHGSLVHLLCNMWSLSVLGPWAEAAWGSARTAVVFVVGGVVGGLCSLAWVESMMVVGASGGLMALAGALWVSRALDASPVLRPISSRALGIGIAVLVGLGFVVPVVAQAGHLGGLAAGLAFGAAWARRPWSRAVIFGSGAALVLLGLGAWRPVFRDAQLRQLGYWSLLEGETDRAAHYLEGLGRSGADDRNALAYALALEGRELARAEALVREALAEDPRNGDYRDTLGWILCRRGETEAGLAELREALELLGSSQDVAEHLERCETASR